VLLLFLLLLLLLLFLLLLLLAVAGALWCTHCKLFVIVVDQADVRTQRH
jgi:hypothetical protein